MITTGSYLASIDIRDAFFPIPSIFKVKYLKFLWLHSGYQFNAIPNIYLGAMRVFTKILKPVFSRLREIRHNQPYK